MKVGVNMLLWTTHVTAENRTQLQSLRSAGADGVEIPIMEGKSAHYRELGRLLDDLGLARTASMAFLEPSQNPASEDPKARQGAADHLQWLIECASQLGAEVIGGPMFQTLGVFSGQGPTAAEMDRAADVLRAAAPAASSAGVVLAVEPLNRFEAYLVNTLADADRFVARVGHPAVGVLFDTFHANIEEKHPVDCIARHGGSIRHVHASASDRGIPGRDHVNWKETFEALRAIGYDSWLVIEAFGRALPGLAAATRIWRDMFPSAEEVAPEGISFVRRTWQQAKP